MPGSLQLKTFIHRQASEPRSTTWPQAKQQHLPDNAFRNQIVLRCVSWYFMKTASRASVHVSLCVYLTPSDPPSPRAHSALAIKCQLARLRAQTLTVIRSGVRMYAYRRSMCGLGHVQAEEGCMGMHRARFSVHYADT